MRINKVVRFEGNNGRNITFQRKLKESEKAGYTGTIEEALDYLGIVNRAMIIHGASFPSKGREQEIGSPYNNEKFLDFLKLHGFNGIQLGPTGKLNKGDTSPYSSSIFAKNPLFIDLSLLTDKKYASLLSQKELNELTQKTQTTDNNWTRADFEQAEKIMEKGLETAYDNFAQKLENQDKSAEKLYDEFEAFQKENDYWLDYYAVLDTISQKYGTDYYPNWSQEDRNLIPLVKAGNKNAIAEYQAIKDDKDYEIDFYKFKQFIIDKQSKEDDKKRGDFVYISDLLVGASSFDELIFNDVFLKDYKVGAKEGGVMNSPQLWNISLVDPNKLFNHDGTLAEGGKFIKLKIQKAIQDAKNIRIDHAMGLVDPFIYNPSTIVYTEQEDSEGNKAYCPDRKKLVAGYLSESKIDKHKNYQKIIPNIIIPTLKEAGINPKEVVWEDLGSDETGVFEKVFRKENHLPGISVMAWGRGEEAPEENWSYFGCHDNMTARQTVEQGLHKDSDAWNLDYLSGYLNPNPHRVRQRTHFKHTIENNPKEIVKAKFADLMRSTKNIQIMFTDFFGMNKRYNTPGTTGKDNWTLRLPADYEDKYYKSLEEDDWAINMPEILKIAVQAKEDMDYVQNKGDEHQAQHLIDRLHHYSKILKEKE